MQQQHSNKTAVESIAHDLWIKRGRPIGDPMTDWVQAEKIVAATRKPSTMSRRKRGS